MSGFRKASRERLRAELAEAVQRMDVQSIHTLLADNRGDAVDVAAVIGTSPASEELRQALAADYRDWAAEMTDDDVATEVPSVLLALDQPSLMTLLEQS